MQKLNTPVLMFLSSLLEEQQLDDDWSVFHFSLGNPFGPDEGNVAKLLRSLADTIEAKGDIQVMDITFFHKPTVLGDDLQMTVYYTR